MKRGYRVLSLFGGIETGYAALKDAGVPIECYYSSEIDKNAIKAAKWNYPQIVHIGDVKDVEVVNLPFVPDIILGGFPCQDLSVAGLGAGLDGARSGLFYEAVRILNECRAINPKVLFLFENVPMAKKHEYRISETLGLAPWKNCASLVSAQTRKRLWWSNIRTRTGLFGDVTTDFPQPEDQGIMLADILERKVSDKYLVGAAAMARINRSRYSKPAVNPLKTGTVNCKNNSGQLSLDSGTTLIGVVNNNGALQQVEKSNCVDANYHKGMDNHGQSPLAVVVHKNGNPRENQGKASCFMAGGNSGGNHSDMDLIACLDDLEADNVLIVTHNLQPRNGKGQGGKGHLSKNDGKSYCCDTGNWQAVEIRGAALRRQVKSGQLEKRTEFRQDGKANCVTQFQQMSCVSEGPTLRRLTPVEVCRLFTLPDDFFQTPAGPIIAETNQYKALGNGWVMKVVSHIFSFLPQLPE